MSATATLPTPEDASDDGGTEVAYLTSCLAAVRSVLEKAIAGDYMSEDELRSAAEELDAIDRYLKRRKRSLSA